MQLRVLRDIGWAASLFVLCTQLSSVDAKAPPRTKVKEVLVDEAPRLTEGLILEREDGKMLDLGALRGERVLLITWASW